MSRHLMMRSANPALGSNAFSKTHAAPGESTMTVDGTVNKTSFCLILLIISASHTWQNPSSSLMVAGGIIGFLVAIVTVFKKTWAPYTTPTYAVCKGLLLGGLSQVFEQRYPGIVSQAVFLTFGVLGALLLAYKSRLIRATENFKLGVFAATGGIALVYLINLVMGFFGSSIPMVHSASTFGILFSLFVVVIASLNLVLDFDFIEQGSESGAPKYMEWYGAFGLLVTLVWLYIEILHLLSKLQSRR